MSNKQWNVGCVCGCGMGSSLLLKMLVTDVFDKYGIDGSVECYDSGTVENSVNLIITSSAFYEGLRAQFGEGMPIVCVKNFNSAEEIEEKLKEIDVL